MHVILQKLTYIDKEIIDEPIKELLNQFNNITVHDQPNESIN